jgi:hypothetical protein
MTIPINICKKQSGSDAPRDKRSPTATKFRNLIAIWNVPPAAGKQKRQAFAAFLGFWAFPPNVLGGCCNPTTTLTDFGVG